MPPDRFYFYSGSRSNFVFNEKRAPDRQHTIAVWYDAVGTPRASQEGSNFRAKNNIFFLLITHEGKTHISLIIECRWKSLLAHWILQLKTLIVYILCFALQTAHDKYNINIFEWFSRYYVGIKRNGIYNNVLQTLICCSTATIYIVIVLFLFYPSKSPKK